MNIINREHWLQEAVKPLARMMKKRANVDLPECRVACGFTGSRLGMRAIGVAWNKRVTSDGVAQVYISPLVADGLRVLDILLHELIHVAFPEAGHKGDFKRVAKACGLKGKMTATVASRTLADELDRNILKVLGAYPHAAISRPVRPRAPKGRPVIIIDPTTGTQITAGANSLVKLVEPASESGYALWMEARFLEIGNGFPTSPFGNVMQLAPTKPTTKGKK